MGSRDATGATYGHTISFVDIDETFFHTFAKVKVYNGDELVRELDNQQFNTYRLKPGERFDFGQFRDAEYFLETSLPIPETIHQVQKILAHIERWEDGSRVVFLTARSDFDDKAAFLKTFRKYGFNVDSPYVYIERSGNLTDGTVDEKKRTIVLEYILSGHFKRVRMFDDNEENLTTFLAIRDSLPQRVLDRARHYHGISRRRADQNVIEFVGMLVAAGEPMKRVEP